MTKKFEIVGGPSREDLFDCLRLSGGDQRMFSVEFKVKEVDFPLIIKTIQSLEYIGNEHTHERFEWSLKSRGAHIVSYFQSEGDPDHWSSNYLVEITFNTKTRQGTATVTRVATDK